jgi:outer membrane murein-binding lipoprotein Lpp
MGAKLLLEIMRGTAPHCTFCHGVPREDGVLEGGPLPGVTAQGVDVNWGDNLYICQDCIRVAGELIGMIPTVKAEKLEKQIDFRNKQVEKLQAQNEKLQAQMDAMLAGAQAAREAKAAAKKKAKS